MLLRRFGANIICANELAEECLILAPILYKWTPGPLNLLIVQIKTCFPSPEVTVFFILCLGFSQTENGKKAQSTKQSLTSL